MSSHYTVTCCACGWCTCDRYDMRFLFSTLLRQNLTWQLYSHLATVSDSRYYGRVSVTYWTTDGWGSRCISVFLAACHCGCLSVCLWISVSMCVCVCQFATMCVQGSTWWSSPSEPHPWWRAACWKHQSVMGSLQPRSEWKKCCY